MFSPRQYGGRNTVGSAGKDGDDVIAKTIIEVAPSVAAPARNNGRVIGNGGSPEEFFETSSDGIVDLETIGRVIFGTILFALVRGNRCHQYREEEELCDGRDEHLWPGIVR